MKKAFTMAEILISLAILGVVAALTMPNLNVNVQKSQCGPALMKAINDIEQSNRWILNDRDSKNIEIACEIPEGDIGDAYLECLAPPLKLDKAVISKSTQYVLKDGSAGLGNDGSLTTSRNDVYSLGAVNIWASDSATSDESGDKLVTLFIDTNGIEKAPNILGKDLHKVYLNVKTNTISGIDDKNLLENMNKITESCEKYGEYCAYLIIRNNGKINYKW